LKYLFDEQIMVNKRVIASAPGRVNLIGEHIDYNDGWVLPFAIEYRTRVELSLIDSPVIRISSKQQEESIEIAVAKICPAQRRNDWSDYVLGVLWALGIHDLKVLGDQGLEIVVDGQVPLGAGLSSSAALECATAMALNTLFALDLSLPELARAAQRAENDYVGMPCGIMDQSISLMAKSGHALLLDCVDLSSEQIPLDFASSHLQLLIIDTNVHHALVDGGYAERRETCEAALRQIGFRSMRDLDLNQLELFGNSLDEVSYKRVRHAVTEIDRVHRCVKALRAGNFEEVGKLLFESHYSLRDDYEVSAPELNLAVDLAQAHGALGARMIGGGFGGSAIALVKIDELETLRAAIENGFAEAKFLPPRFFVTTPSDGAKIEL